MAASRDQFLSDALLAVYDVVAGTNDAIAPTLNEYGLTAKTAHLLWVVDPNQPAPSMRVLAERTHCTPQNVTFMCQQLESRGLVQRRSQAGDQRQRVVELTPRGREARASLLTHLSHSSPLAGMDARSLHRLIQLLTT